MIDVAHPCADSNPLIHTTINDAFFSNETDFLFAQETYLNELEIDSSTKLNNNSDLPTNPFEIVEMIRRANSMNDATNPSDAIDDALKSFEMTNENDKL